MDEQTISILGQRLQDAAAGFPYPPTPDLAAASVTRRQPRPALRLRWALAAITVAAASLLAVPSVRAKMMEFFQVGAVRINLPAANRAAKSQHLTRKRKLSPQPAVLGSILELSGETSLAAARAAVSFPVELPQFPETLGEPDHVYLQHTDLADYVVMAWVDAAGQVELVQYVIPRGVQLTKGSPKVVDVTSVKGYLAIWTDSEYLLDVDGYNQPMRFINQPALIWADGQLTYRLEANLSLDELVRIAESIPQGQ